jgi:CheY-like chemotaxis protein
MEGFTPDMILLDLVMPVMDGTAFLQRLRKDPVGVEVPVVICTGKELSFNDRRRLLTQATEILTKGEDFESRLRSVLASFFPLDPGLLRSRTEAGEEAESDSEP